MKHILLFIALVLPVTTFATGYDYLPDDVWIKQQEEKSALEFRLRQLEAGMNGSLDSSLRNIEFRIDELERELQTQINYVTGTYGSYGIANQLPSAIAKLESEFAVEISHLEDERDELKRLIREQEDAEEEVARLEIQIAELESLYVDDSPIEYSPVTELERPSASEMFEYIDSLPLAEASDVFSDLRVADPALYEEVAYIVNLKYPNGKPGSAKYEEHEAAELADIANILQALQSEIQAATTPDIEPEPVYVPPVRVSVQEPVMSPRPEIIAEPVSENPVLATTTDETATTTDPDIFTLEYEDIPVPEPGPPVTTEPGFLSRVITFFTKWF